MMERIKILSLLSILTFVLLNCSNGVEEKIIASFNAVNTQDFQRQDEVISIPLGSLNYEKESKTLYATAGGEVIPTQLFDENGDEIIDAILLLLSFEPNERIKIDIFSSDSVKESSQSRVYAELAVKKDYNLVNGIYEGGTFVNIDRIKVPTPHTDHDNLFKYEGPGWESDKVGYRFYLDWRNTTDIFGKKTSELILHKVGRTDLSAENHSYHKMNEWGMDIFNVGNSLGIGSIATYDGESIIKISETDSVICSISDNGPILAAVNTGFYGWKVNDNKVNLNSRFSINAGRRLTKVDIQVSEGVENITTGLAKHENVIENIRSSFKGGWQYLSIYGQQSLSGDNLGIVVFFDQNNLIDIKSDELNYFVILKPIDGFVTYYFAAVWEQELNGIDNRLDFIEFMQQTKHKLNNPIIVENNFNK
jgi:hypothetical protein